MDRRLQKKTLLAFFVWAGLAAPALGADFRSIGDAPAILYDAPSLKAKKLFVVSPLYPVEVVVSLESWAKVKDETGDLAWVEKKDLADRRTVIVTASLADVRQAPDPNAPLLFRAQKNVVLDFLEPAAPGWAKVRSQDGQTGYVNLTQVWGG